MPTTTKLPTKSQAALIARFADRPFPEKVRTSETTHQKCRDNGWIERTDTWPHHQTTPDGIAALNAYEQANQPAYTTAHLMGLVEAYGQACYLHGPNTRDAHGLHEQIRQALVGKEA